LYLPTPSSLLFMYADNACDVSVACMCSFNIMQTSLCWLVLPHSLSRGTFMYHYHSQYYHADVMLYTISLYRLVRGGVCQDTYMLLRGPHLCLGHRPMCSMYQLMLQPLCCVYNSAKIASCHAVCQQPC
jgi:hypothetical protein